VREEELVDRLIERVAELDVHKASVKACGRVPGGHHGERGSETRTFRTTTAELVLLRDWLASQQVQVVGMESTGVLWKPVYYLAASPSEPRVARPAVASGQVRVSRGVAARPRLCPHKVGIRP
jgi:hypothetical protein